MRIELHRCERCLRRKPELHEITQGYGRRHLALMERALIVGLCRQCHEWVHSKGLKGKLYCLALLKLRRPQDYNIAKFWEVNGRRWPEPEEVSECEKLILRGHFEATK